MLYETEDVQVSKKITGMVHPGVCHGFSQSVL